MASTEGLDAVRTDLGRQIGIAWPGSSGEGHSLTLPDVRVPIVYFGNGVAKRVVPGDVLLDSIAPTLQEIVGLHRDHPDVRTGEAIPGVATSNASTPLVVLIAWKGIGTPDLESSPAAWPFLRRAMRSGAGTISATTGSLPLDPAATLTTIGTGALPSSHGITGSLIRDDEGKLLPAWSSTDAGSVIATFGDDLDHAKDETPGVAAVLTDPSDRGLIGDGWYVDASDHDAIVVNRGSAPRAEAATRSIVSSEELGEDDVTDLLGVVLEGSVAEVDAATADVVATIRELVPMATFVVTGTGSARGIGGIEASALGAAIDEAIGAPIVEGTAADGYFLDRRVLVDREITTQRVAELLLGHRRDGEAVFADVYPSFAVSFSRYC